MKIRNAIWMLICLAANTVAPVAFASPTIDVNQPVNNTYMAGFNQGGLAQSFKPTQTNVDGAGIFLQSGIGRTDTVTIGLWDALPNQGGNELTFGSGIGTAGTNFDVFFNPISVVAGQTYYLVFTSLANTLGIAGATNNPYLGGATYANNYSRFNSFDYTFRTFYEPSQQTSNVPEPATLALLGFGMVGFLVSRRKSAK